VSAQAIGEPVDQRSFRPDHHQANRPVIAGPRHGGVIAKVEIEQLGMLGDARVAGGRVEPILRARQQPGLRQFPRQRMFAATAAQQKDVHARSRLH